ncbi:MAG: hypothetical protein Q9P14_03985 [candidate division KSB1 bacterium]|nr:hypothetical protein [candidate division KSB1 bacterium]MDQ7062938.1 hypothetical protein [candidate division KSB1 bacterium]
MDRIDYIGPFFDMAIFLDAASRRNRAAFSSRFMMYGDDKMDHKKRIRIEHATAMRFCGKWPIPHGL